MRNPTEVLYYGRQSEVAIPVWLMSGVLCSSCWMTLKRRGHGVLWKVRCPSG